MTRAEQRQRRERIQRARKRLGLALARLTLSESAEAEASALVYASLAVEDLAAGDGLDIAIAALDELAKP